MLRFLARLLLLLAFVVVLTVAAFAWWALRPLELPADGAADRVSADRVLADRIDFTVAPGTGVRGVAMQLQKAGVEVDPRLFALLARGSGLDTQIKAGGYEITRGDSIWRLLQRMAQGDMTHARITFIEGWTYRQIRDELRRHPDIRQTLADDDDQALLERLGATATHPEGLFFPDTYSFAKGSADFDVLRRAYMALRQQLEAAWQARAKDVPLASPYELLILASIVEKETGHEPERARIAGVFANRLRIGMPLQTDPTVIYGMGERYEGRITRQDLQADTLWNTYTRRGLPPTPIANPGRASLMAAAQPEPHKFLYFVSRGDGTSEFSTDLGTHNRHVSRYLRGGR
jgi:UPF0755 protein